jgi:long-chain acyl-CoA synthetase
MAKAGEKIEKVFRTHADRTFLLWQGRELTYAAFEERCRRVAGLLRSRGLGHHAGRESRVATILNNSPDYAAFYLGSLLAGVTIAPINQNLTAEEISFLIANSAIDLLVYSPDQEALVRKATADTGCRTLCLAGSGDDARGVATETCRLDAAVPDGALRWAEIPDQHTIAVVFSSGTTSHPKGIRHRALSYVEAATAFGSAMGYDARTRLIDLWPMAYNTGWLNCLLCPFFAGGSVVISKPFDGQLALSFWEPVIAQGVNTLWLSPSMLSTLVRIDRDPRGPEYCRRERVTVCAGTAPLPLKTKKAFEVKYGVEVFESYGVSEVLFVAMSRPSDPRHEGAVGRALPGVEIAIVDGDGRSVGPDAEGEVVIRSPWLMKGYDPRDGAAEPSAAANGAFHSGDIGVLDREGNLRIVGRKKDIIIRGGLNLSPRAIEDVIQDHPAVDLVAVVGMPHEYYGEEVVAAVQLKAGHVLADEHASMANLCRARLSTAAIPSRFVAFRQLPVGATGKILKREIREVLRKGDALAS